MLTDEQILESWNEIHKRLGYPPIVKILPDEKKVPTIEDAEAIEANPHSASTVIDPS